MFPLHIWSKAVRKFLERVQNHWRKKKKQYCAEKSHINIKRPNNLFGVRIAYHFDPMCWCCKLNNRMKNKIKEALRAPTSLIFTNCSPHADTSRILCRNTLDF